MSNKNKNINNFKMSQLVDGYLPVERNMLTFFC